jgi:hypothetical protein
MKAIKHKANIGSISAKVDGSIAYRVSTPELSAEEKSTMFDLQNVNVEVLISPFETKEEIELIDVKKDLETKTPSQRLRAVMFLLWKKNNEGYELFETFYEKKMNGIIEHLKGKIDD